MTKHTPPRLATWLLAHISPGYRRDSFIGDLIEQYRQGRNARWYWRQVAVALGLAGARLLRTAFSLSAAALLLRIAAESFAVTALISLTYEYQSHRASAPGNFLPPLGLAILALLCLAAFVLYLPSTATRSAGKSTAFKRLLAAFAAITLSAATLTWAGTTAGAVSSAAHATTCPRTSVGIPARSLGGKRPFVTDRSQIVSSRSAGQRPAANFAGPGHFPTLNV